MKGEEVKGVVFLSYAASERGKRWDPGGVPLAGWSARLQTCVNVCVNARVCVRESQKIKKGSVCMVPNHGDNGKDSHISQGPFDLSFSFFFKTHFSFLRLLLLFLCHCFSTHSLHMHIL